MGRCGGTHRRRWTSWSSLMAEIDSNRGFRRDGPFISPNVSLREPVLYRSCLIDVGISQIDKFSKTKIIIVVKTEVNRTSNTSLCFREIKEMARVLLW